MPYITDQARKQLQFNIDVIPNSAGELNYCVTQLVRYYLYRDIRGPRYQDFNDVLGALEGAKLELYRRLIGPYEDLKIKENGDAY